MENEKKSIEEQYLADTKPNLFKLPVGETFIEFLSDGERKQIKYGEGDVKEKICYIINAYDRTGLSLCKEIEFPMPKTILDAISELRVQNGGSVVNGWVKVKREGTDKTGTKYIAYPSVKPKW